MIVADPRNPAALALRDALQAHVGDADLGEVAVVIGGDGFMLHVIAEHGMDRCYLGLNAGRIGFLMNDVGDVGQVAGAILRRAWDEVSFPALHAVAHLQGGGQREVRAVNDVVLERSTGQTAHLRLAIDGTEVVDTLVADGIIFSTALGSTAYTFSAGGPACHPTLPVLAVTAICPHHPRLAPVVLPAGSTACVTVQAAHRRPVRAMADGNPVDDVVGLDVSVGQKRVRLAWLEGYDFTARMITKIVRP